MAKRKNFKKLIIKIQEPEETPEQRFRRLMAKKDPIKKIANKLKKTMQ